MLSLEDRDSLEILERIINIFDFDGITINIDWKFGEIHAFIKCKFAEIEKANSHSQNFITEHKYSVRMS